MSTVKIATAPRVTRPSVLAGWMARHPLVAYFALAYGLTWILVLPIMASQRGLGLINLPDPLLLVLFIGSTFAGPLPAAFIMVSITDGKVGRELLWRRMLQWKVGAGWYLLVFLGIPALYLVGLTVYLGGAPWQALAQNWQLVFTFYLPTALFGIIFPGLGEEPGWRGFALPRLQQKYGALLGTLMLGVLHGLWHLPAYFIPGTILNGPFNLWEFLANTAGIIAATVIWTWVFNHTGGSVFFAMVVHGVINANSGLLPRLMTHTTGDLWFSAKVAIAGALLIILFTRGRLGYQPAREAPAAG